MIWRSLLAVLIALAVALLPQAVLAEDEALPPRPIEFIRALSAQKGPRADHPGPQPPPPGLLFKRLDANADGKLTVDEIPEGAPDRFKAMLKRADRNEDKVITGEELAAVAKELRPPGPGPGSRRPGPPEAGLRPPGPLPLPAVGRPPAEMRPPFMGRGGDGPQPFAPWPGMRPPFMGRGGGPHPFGPRPGIHGPFMGRGVGPHPFRPPSARPELADPKVAFARLDRDKDGKLSLEEFAQGMRMARARAAMAHRTMAAGRADMARRAAVVRREAEARKHPAPAARRPAKLDVTPEARRKDAEATAAAKHRAEARNKQTEARKTKAAEAKRKRAASAEKRRTRKPANQAESKP